MAHCKLIQQREDSQPDNFQLSAVLAIHCLQPATKINALSLITYNTAQPYTNFRFCVVGQNAPQLFLTKSDTLATVSTQQKSQTVGTAAFIDKRHVCVFTF